MYQLLPAPYKELWLSWDSEGQHIKAQESEAEKEERMAFIQSLAASSSKAAGRPGADTVGRAQEAGEGAEGSVPADEGPARQVCSCSRDLLKNWSIHIYRQEPVILFP